MVLCCVCAEREPSECVRSNLEAMLACSLQAHTSNECAVAASQLTHSTQLSQFQQSQDLAAAAVCAVCFEYARPLQELQSSQFCAARSSDELPAIVCTQPGCHRAFHHSCLFQVPARPASSFFIFHSSNNIPPPRCPTTTTILPISSISHSHMIH